MIADEQRLSETATDLPPMQQRSYQIRFLNPAFLGNAEQAGQWRTPPVKALLRQFWRIAYAASRNFNVSVDGMRRDEAHVFGSAEREDTSRSRVRIRLDSWEPGRRQDWNGLECPPIRHDEVERTNYRVAPHAYLGYGPLDGRGGTQLAKGRSAIDAEASTLLHLAFPDEGELTRYIDEALVLIDLFGTLGSRSRNGWGSLALTPVRGTSALHLQRLPLCDWRQALRLDWAHALGQDDAGRPLLWATNPCESWREAMTELARVKIAVRTAQPFKFRLARPSGEPERRHWLAYPVTNHDVRSWGKNARLPNTLRFKLRETGAKGKSGKPMVRGLVFHMPCRPIDTFGDVRAADLEAIWQDVHELLDSQRGLTRVTQETL